MWVAWMAAATLASGCGPDYYEQAPVLCAEIVPVPIVREYPVAPDGAVSIAARWRSGWQELQLVGSDACTDYLRRKKLVARIWRCGPMIEIWIGRRDRSAPGAAQITVAGGVPAP